MSLLVLGEVTRLAKGAFMKLGVELILFNFVLFFVDLIALNFLIDVQVLKYFD